MKVLLLSLAPLLAPFLALGAHYDLLIQNAYVIDGSGNPRFRADIAVNGARRRSQPNREPSIGCGGGLQAPPVLPHGRSSECLRGFVALPPEYVAALLKPRGP